MGVEMQTVANTSHEYNNLLVYFHKRTLTSAKFGVVTYPVIKCRRTISFIHARHGAAIWEDDCLIKYAPTDFGITVRQTDRSQPIPRYVQLNASPPGTAAKLAKMLDDADTTFWKDVTIKALNGDPLDAELNAKLKSLLALDFPTITEFRDVKLCDMIHCLSLEAKAIVRATKVASVSWQLGKGVRSWATRVAYGFSSSNFQPLMG